MRPEPSDVLRGKDNNCALIAFYNVLSTNSEQRIYDVAVKHGFSEDRGIPTVKIPTAARDLGIKIKERKEVHDRWDSPKPFKVQEVRRTFAGTNLCLVKGHIFVIHNADIIDPNDVNYGLRREVVRMWEVKNSDLAYDNSPILFETRLGWKTHWSECSRPNSSYRKRFQELEITFGETFTPREIRKLFSLKETVNLVRRGIFLKKMH